MSDDSLGHSRFENVRFSGGLMNHPRVPAGLTAKVHRDRRSVGRHACDLAVLLTFRARPFLRWAGIGGHL